MRANAIYSCLKYGLLPWWMYEDVKHYECSYISHLWLNIQYMCRWLTFQEYESDIEFEKEYNL
jgi:hypothetical protein